uniref:Uncharacterized protein n=1 Tax=Anopheles culicifacies TaxID=139723 RepID=A0A182M949_9DIPT
MMTYVTRAHIRGSVDREERTQNVNRRRVGQRLYDQTQSHAGREPWVNRVYLEMHRLGCVQDLHYGNLVPKRSDINAGSAIILCSGYYEVGTTTYPTATAISDDDASQEAKV